MENIEDKNKPLIPYIELDGGYARCSNCFKEVKIDENICPYCNQVQDWSWFGKYNKNID